jgi:ribose transport system permease protein
MKKEIGIFILLVLLCAFASSKPQWHFLTVYNLQNTSRLVGMFGILGIAVGFVIITGGIDLSIGSVLALEGVLLVMMLADYHWPWPLAVGVTLLGAILIGAFHGFLVAKGRMQSFILTLCGYLVYRSLARYVSDDANKGFGDSSYGSLRQLATGTFHDIPMPFITFVIIAFICWVLLHRSVYGRYLFAVGQNEDAARYSGVNSRLVIASAYVLCTLLTAIAGIIFALDTNSIQGTDFGLGYELYGIAAAVLGGCSLRGGEGSIIGIAIGTALLQVIQNVAELMGIPSPLSGALTGAIIFFGVLADQFLAQRKRKLR